MLTYRGIFENKKFVVEYPEPGERNVREIFTAKDILDDYYDYWSTKMYKAGKLLAATEDNCIEDFLTVHWGYEFNNSTRSAG